MSGIRKYGLTGGIGSGKTTVSKVFLCLGVPVYYADDRSRWLLENDPELRKNLIAAFGEQAFRNNTLDRRYMAETVFKDKEKVNLLNSIVHPAVGKDFEQWAVTQENAGEKYIVKEAALIFEAGSWKSLDDVITVTCPENIRIERVMKRDPLRTLDEIKSILARQWSEEDKVKQSAYIIVNDGAEPVIPQVLELHQKLLSNT